MNVIRRRQRHETTQKGQIATRRRIDGRAEALIHELGLEGWEPAQIHAELKRRLRRVPIPTLRTVQRIISEEYRPGSSAEWSLADSDPEDARTVLDVLAEVTERTQGRVAMTQELADWVVRVGRAVPELSATPWTLYVLARAYEMGSRNEQTRDLDLFLAYRPWEGQAAMDRYKAVLEHPLVPGPLGHFPPLMLIVLASHGIDVVQSTTTRSRSHAKP